jgi:hypothetical protein
LKTNDPASPVVPVLVEANIQNLVTVTPSSLNFKNVKAGEEKTLNLIVRGTKAFTIKSIDGLDSDLTVDLPANPQPVHTLKFKFQSTKVGDFKRQLQINTDLQASSVPVTVEGKVIP